MYCCHYTGTISFDKQFFFGSNFVEYLFRLSGSAQVINTPTTILYVVATILYNILQCKLPILILYLQLNVYFWAYILKMSFLLRQAIQNINKKCTTAGIIRPLLCNTINNNLYHSTTVSRQKQSTGITGMLVLIFDLYNSVILVGVVV